MSTGFEHDTNSRFLAEKVVDSNPRKVAVHTLSKIVPKWSNQRLGLIAEYSLMRFETMRQDGYIKIVRNAVGEHWGVREIGGAHRLAAQKLRGDRYVKVGCFRYAEAKAIFSWPKQWSCGWTLRGRSHRVMPIGTPKLVLEGSPKGSLF